MIPPDAQILEISIAYRMLPLGRRIRVGRITVYTHHGRIRVHGKPFPTKDMEALEDNNVRLQQMIHRKERLYGISPADSD